jgi:two-component system sensor histidine kinase EvgS
MEGDEEEILQMGCDGYLRKPVTKKALINELARFLEHDESEIEEQDDNETEKECIDDDPAKIKEHMPELLGELKLSIGSALETGSMDDAMEVSERMKSFGEECGLGTIAEWGAKLKDLVESFEIEGMMSHMKDYDRLVSRLQAFAEGEGE